MTLYDHKITNIFYLNDDFCKEFELIIQNHSLGHKSKRKPRMNTSEVITIIDIIWMEERAFEFVNE